MGLQQREADHPVLWQTPLGLMLSTLLADNNGR